VEGLGGFERVEPVLTVVLRTDHLEGFHHTVYVLRTVPIEGHRNTVLDGVVGMIFDFETAHLFLPKCDPNLSLPVKRDRVPKFVRRFYHVRVLGRNIGFEQFEYRRPTATLDEDVV